MMSSEESHRKVFAFIIKTGIKLEAKNVTICTTSVLTYRTMRKEVCKELCPYTIACACFLLAAKIEEDQRVRIRDVINVSYSVLHGDKPMLQVDEEMWAIREGIARMEYVVLRLLRFRLNVENPHKVIFSYAFGAKFQYLLQYVSSLQHWCRGDLSWNGVAEICFILLRDAHISPGWVLSHSPQTIAIVCMSVAIRAAKVKIEERWYSTFSVSMTRSKLRRLEEEFLSKVLMR
ncbi:unnamed protein product [Anisakis simplex]|uniref:Cyclin N-terminal domain-containing protein n=1 Tax=Anisakis simplex TaxID=6269 RepID=A0A3P6SB83_ANISI|nr:unnamed protein product [Anisakis simplex]